MAGFDGSAGFDGLPGLSGAGLSGAGLSGAGLSGAGLSGAGFDGLAGLSGLDGRSAGWPTWDECPDEWPSECEDAEPAGSSAYGERFSVRSWRSPARPTSLPARTAATAPFDAPSVVGDVLGAGPAEVVAVGEAEAELEPDGEAGADGEPEPDGEADVDGEAEGNGEAEADREAESEAGAEGWLEGG